jgi:hypothetical protein
MLREVSVRGRTLQATALAVAAAVVAISFLVAAAQDGDFAYDFNHTFLPAADDVVHGRTPYPAHDDSAVAGRTAYVYPPFAAVVLAPFTWLPADALEVAFTVLLAAAVAGTLRLLGVSDLRCYAVCFLWGPVLAGLQTANLTLLLGLATAAVWRWRDDRLRLPVGLALALAPKIFLWPLAVWTLVTRRAVAALSGVALALGLTAVTWAILGFAGLGGYVPLLRELGRLEEADAYTAFALLVELGVGEEIARAVWLCIGLSALVACALVARRDERRGFALAIAATLLLAPIVWLHYFALLLVPLAIQRPRFDLVWLAPVLLIGASGTGNGGTGQTVLVLLVAAVVSAAALFTQRPATQAPLRSTTIESSA